MTVPIFAKIVLMSLLEPTIDQNLYFLGLKYTTATFAAAMANVLPAITFVMACCCRLEKVKLTSKHSQAKIIGTLATVGGAMIMTLVQGPNIHFPWTKDETTLSHKQGEINLQDLIKGALMITAGCFSWAFFVILQVTTLRSYPAELSLTAWICLFGTAGGAIVALFMEKEKASWSIRWDLGFLAAAYSGIFCSGIAYYVQGAVMTERGPVFVSAFSPLSMVIVAILSSTILAEQMYLGRIIGAIVIIVGLYFVVWGKSKDYKSTEQRVTTNEHGDNGNSNSEIITVDSWIGTDRLTGEIEDWVNACRFRALMAELLHCNLL
ncbi:hypothetical protein CDL12_16198 [Handroanthus impetiginosus]|uniref:WAT1-related protein n=1 Tax=Handroanthus impetiginosus TaxID=429701 RepID=A0A2G9H0Z8_9LAMI|nr:hypothetical protein CDL12_16198 [Handroanthus impetiginosus]